jgi:hypothetical protein
MQQEDEDHDNTCEFNDFALVELDPDDVQRTNPTVPFFGGPTGLDDSTDSLDDVYSYGNSSLRGGLEALKPKFGKSLGQSGGGWNHEVYTLTPGIPGDSGSAFLNDDGEAFGTLTTVQLAPKPASNGVTDLSRALDYLNEKTDLDVELVEGTEDFKALPVPSGLDQSLPADLDADEGGEDEADDEADSDDEGGDDDDDDDRSGLDDVVDEVIDDVGDLLDR